VSKVRLTGGEPLTRHRLPDLARRLSRLPGVRDLSLSTNGTRLARHAAALRRAGVARLNVSLDSLNRERVCQITGRDVLPQVTDGLLVAARAGFAPIKINMVVMADTGDDEIDDMVAFCIQHGFILRMIEVMPVGESGRATGYRSLEPIRQRLVEHFGLIEALVPGGGPARYLVSADGRFSVGFITPISQHFCASCNRVRLSVDGTLYLCLGQDDRLELRPLLRAGVTNATLEAQIRDAIARKPERHEFREQPRKIVRIMSMTGG
jgi:cyclic pyranopterin phosphate synthase